MSKINIEVDFHDELDSGQVESRMARMRAIIGEKAEGFTWSTLKIDERDGKRYFVQDAASVRYGQCRLEYDSEGTLVYETGNDIDPEYQSRLEIDLTQVVACRSAEDTIDDIATAPSDYDPLTDAARLADLYRPIPGVTSVGFLNERVTEGVLSFSAVHVKGAHLSDERSRLDFCADGLRKLLGLNFPHRSYGDYGEHLATGNDCKGNKCTIWLAEESCDIRFSAEQGIPADKRAEYLGKVETALIGTLELVE